MCECDKLSLAIRNGYKLRHQMMYGNSELNFTKKRRRIWGSEVQVFPNINGKEFNHLTAT